MRLTSTLLAASCVFVLGACGEGGEALSEDAAAANGMYDTVQPDLSGAEDQNSIAVGSALEPAPLPDAITGDIIMIARKSGDFTMFITAIEAVGLAETLQGPGPFTVFAPTDDAFETMPDGALEDLLRPANREKLASLVEYHVLPARVTTEDITRDTPSPATVHGDPLAFEVTDDGEVKAGEAKVVTADILATNGVMHIVDAVLTPEAEASIAP